MTIRPRRPPPAEWLSGWLADVEAAHAASRGKGWPGPDPVPSLAGVRRLRRGRPIRVQGVRLPREVLVDAGLHPVHLWRFVVVHPDGRVVPVDRLVAV